MADHPERDFVAFLESYRPQMRRLGDRLLHGHKSLTASDLVQDVLVFAWERCPEHVRSGSDEQKQRWLTKAMVWTALKAHRAFHRQKRDSDRESPIGPDASRELSDPGPSPIDQVESAEASERLWAALDALSGTQLTLVRQYYWEQNSIPKIAAQKGVAPSSVWTALRRIERNLRRQLAEE